MIQIPQAGFPQNGFPLDDQAEAAVTAEADPQTARLPANDGDVLARFNGMPGMHASVQRFAYGSPNGPGGGATGSTAGSSGGKATTAADPDAKRMEAARKQAQAWMNEGNKLLKQGRYNEAIEAYDAGFRTYPSEKFLLNKAAALFDAGRYAEALLAYESYLSNPDAERADEVRVQIDRAREKLGGRDVTMSDVVASRQLVEQGEKAVKAGRFEEALAAFEKAYEHNPMAEFKFNQATCLAKLGRPYAAAERLQSYLALKPDARDAAQVFAQIRQLRAEGDSKPITLGGQAGGMEWMARGNLLLHARRFDEAVQAFREGFRTYPSEKFILNEAAALTDGGRYAEAERAYERYLANPDAPRADEARETLERVRSYLSRGITSATEAKAADAADAHRSAKALKEAQVWMQEGNKLLKQGRFNEAIEAYEAGFRTYPSEKFLLNKASALFDAGRYAEALMAYETYLSNPDAERAGEVRVQIDRAREKLGGRDVTMSDVVESRRLVEQGERAVGAGRFEEALAAFEKAYELNPMAEFKYNQAVCLEKLGRNYAAISRYSQYVAEKPDAADAGRVRGHIAELRFKADEAPITAGGKAGGYEWMTRGMRHAQAGRHDAAVAAFQEGFRTYPDRDFIRYEAKALLDAGRYAEADLAYQTYLSDPKAPHGDTVRAEQQQARAHMGGREATATGVAESMQLLGKASELYKQGRFAEAFAAFERAYHLNPLGLLRYNQAACLQKMGKNELAAQRYEAYLAETPNAPDAAKVQGMITKLRADAQAAAQAAFDRGAAAFKAGRFNEAAAAFSQAYAQKPASQFLFNVAASFDKGGDRARAIQYYQLYLSMTPGAPDEDRVRKRIDMLQGADGRQLMRP
jgi:tetratricopeptide (TPR) repeat protein